MAAAAAIVGARLAPPPPLGTDAPAPEFSAGRALALVRELAADGAPRPVGTEANRAGVERLLALLRRAGIEPQVQEAFACGPYGVCGRVRNVVARLGSPGKKAILLCAHHDSVAAGPGASDDLAGVAAILESARALRAGPSLPRPVILLVTDSEETGLLGATAFAEQHPWAREVGGVVNVEARGTEGPSLLFDTPGDPAWLRRALRGLRHPNASSLFGAVYRVIPNDTDFTALDRGGLRGVNLAFGFGAVRHHTPRDDLAHLDPASLQHHGDNVVDLARALAAEDLEDEASRPAVFFDVLGAFVVSWPESAALSLAVVAALGVLATAGLLRRDGVRPGTLLAGVAAAVAAPFAAAFAALFAYLALRHGALPRLFVAHPGAFVATCWAAGAGAAFLMAALAARRAGPAGLLAGAGWLFAALGIALALWVPGASHLAVVPAFAFAAFGAGRALARPGSEGWALAAAIGPAAVSATVLVPIALLLPPFLGLPGGVLLAPVVALAVLPVTPLAAVEGRLRFAPAAGAFGAAFVLAGIAAALPHATPDSPERLSIAYHEESSRARWLAEPEHEALPAAMRALAPFSPRPEPPFSWMPHRAAFVAPATPVFLPLPRVDVLSTVQEGDVRRVRARLVSGRKARVLLLALPASVEVVAASVGGCAVPPPASRLRWWLGGGRVIGSVTAPPEGIEAEIAIRGTAPVEVTVIDESLGLPPAGAGLAASRPPSAVPSREGDLTFASAQVKI